MWQSDGADGYTVTQCGKDAPGTDVVMHIKANADGEDYDQYLDTYNPLGAGVDDGEGVLPVAELLLVESVVQELIKKYSDYIRYPIVMEVEDYRQKDKPEDAPEDYKPEWETRRTCP